MHALTRKNKTCLRVIFIGLSFIYSSINWAATEPKPLKLIAVHEIPSTDFEPSGMVFCNDSLLVVSDKDDHNIFELLLTENGINMASSRTLVIPQYHESSLPIFTKIRNWLTNLITNHQYDFEGIACHGQSLFLISESHAAVLHVDDKNIQWLLNAYNAGHEAGMLQKTNAGYEGLAVSSEELLLLAERQPRGIVRYRKNGDTWNSSDATVLNKTHLPNPTSYKREPDFTDGLIENNHLYTLERNHSAVCKRYLTNYEPLVCWSYGAIENNPKYKYKKDKYGLAEGLAVTSDTLYIIIDNNGDERRAKPGNINPILLILEKPVDW